MKPKEEGRSCCTSPGADGSQGVSRKSVMEFYSEAAAGPKSSLCCPENYHPQDISHIPREVLEVSYGCGSPVAKAEIGEGDIVADLGSGGGIDCFIAASKVGSGGRVIGIDMTSEMLKKARDNVHKVSQNLGYSVVNFIKGFLEVLPIKEGMVDLVISNCVINLSTEKEKVFREIHRILKDQGSFVISDIVSSKPVPKSMRENVELWGECISGALTKSELLEVVKKTGFSRISLDEERLWRKVDGIEFYSVTFRGCKFKEGQVSSERF